MSSARVRLPPSSVTVADYYRVHVDVDGRAVVQEGGVWFDRHGSAYRMNTSVEVVLVSSCEGVEAALDQLGAVATESVEPVGDACARFRMPGVGSFQPPGAVYDEGDLLPPPYVSAWIADGLGMHLGEAIALTAAQSYPPRPQKRRSPAAALRRGFFAP